MDPIIVDPIIADPMRTPRMNTVTYYRRGGGAQKGSDEWDPDYIPEEEVW
jgi:hypothetical protein